MGSNGLLHQIFYVFNGLTCSWVYNNKGFFMSSFDNYIMDHYEKMWEEQKEEDHEPEE